MKRVVSLILFSVFLFSNNVHAVFNVITDGDPILASPIMQNFRHVNYGNVLKPVDTNGNPLSNVLDLGTNTAYWRNIYLSGTANVGSGLVVDSGTLYLDPILNRIGISTQNPRESLDVVGTMVQSGGNAVFVENGTSKLFIKSVYSNSNGLQIYNNVATDVASIINGYNSDIVLGTNSLENIRLKASGRFGIGTTIPGSTVGISGNASIGASYAVTAGPSNGIIVEGNVGIGTTSPLWALSVYKSAFSGPQASFGRYAGNGIFINAQSGPAGYSWLVGAENNVSDGFEITPALTAGGLSFSFPIFVVKRGVGIGVNQTSPGSALSVSGNAAIGASYSSTSGPTNGLIVQGPVGIGTPAPSHTLTVVGSANISGALSANGGIDAGGNGLTVCLKRTFIGYWDMDSTSQVTIPHGVNGSKIICIQAYITDDNGTTFRFLTPGGPVPGSGFDGSIGAITSANVTLARGAGGVFDNTSYDSTSINRGDLFIWYAP